jgi:hypothetical protein
LLPLLLLLHLLMLLLPLLLLLHLLMLLHRLPQPASHSLTA